MPFNSRCSRGSIETANIPNYAFNAMTAVVQQHLCAPCRGMTLSALASEEGYRHLENARDLLKSARSCAMCSLIQDALSQNKSFGIEYDYDKLRPEPVILYGRVDESHTTPKGFRLYGFDVHVPVEFGGDDCIDICNMSLWAEPDSLAACTNDIIGRQSLVNSGSGQAFALIKGWISECIQDHDLCRQTLRSFRIDEAVEPLLPRRVVDISGENLRLLDTGLSALPHRGHYVALSHCWGRSPQLTTTSTNFLDRVTSIHFDSMPRTFQDAVTLSRRLGFRYIWIDSLCIIQDSPEDWKSESAKMGAIYQYARITIAATSAANGTVGCFIPRLKMADPVPLPLVAPNGLTVSGVYASLFPNEDDGNIALNPLNERAWITQEWLLSRRTVHFTRGRLIWSCRTRLVSEDGEPLHDESGTQRLEESLAIFDPVNRSHTSDFIGDWTEVANTYCRRKLTYETDKLVALQGIADEIAARTKLGYHYGLWSDLLSRQLLWFAKEGTTRPAALKCTPSWSWASTMGSIVHHNPAQSARQFAGDIVIRGDRLLLRSLLVPAPSFRGPVSHSSPEMRQLHNYMSRSVFLSGAAVIPVELFFCGTTGNELGWAVFDEGVLPSGLLYVLPLSVNVIEGAGDDGYNILLVRPSVADSSLLERVGMGELLRAGWLEGFTPQDICIL